MFIIDLLLWLYEINDVFIYRMDIKNDDEF